jgi:proteic killer suppression protein
MGWSVACPNEIAWRNGWFQKHILRRLDALDAALVAEDLNLPGFNFHGLQGFDPKRYSIHVNGPWAITFEFDEGDAQRVDFELYHSEAP